MWESNDPWLRWDTSPSPYDWSLDPAHATVAKDYAMFDTSSPVVHYDTPELGYPFGTTMWSMCQGLLGQVHLTLPLDSEGRPTTMGAPYASTGTRSNTVNLTYTEEWVQNLVSDAYKHSPLYWHHSTRHTPSQSAVCKRTTAQPPGTGSISGIKYMGFGAMTLGGLQVDCWCGWWSNVTTHCQIPHEACTLLLNNAYSPELDSVCNGNGGRFPVGAVDLWGPMRKVMSLMSTWPSSLPCPALNVSDHWGLHFNAASINTLSARVLNRGPSGIRLGGLAWQSSNLLLTPKSRLMEPVDEYGNTAALECDASPPPQSLVDHFVDELFPAAHGVRQAAPVSYCLRFSIELARLHAYQHANLVLPASQQSITVATWRRRCEMKLKQVTVCETYRVFNINQTSPNCPFEVPAEYAHAVTPGCLVVYEGAAYDPCLCDPAWCVPPIKSGDHMVNPITGLFNQGSKCRVLHVRDLVVDPVTGAPAWPPESDTAVPRPLVNSGGSRGGIITRVIVSQGSTAFVVLLVIFTLLREAHVVLSRQIHVPIQHRSGLKGHRYGAHEHLQILAPEHVTLPLHGREVNQVRQEVHTAHEEKPNRHPGGVGPREVVDHERDKHQHQHVDRRKDARYEGDLHCTEDEYQPNAHGVGLLGVHKPQVGVQQQHLRKRQYPWRARIVGNKRLHVKQEGKADAHVTRVYARVPPPKHARRGVKRVKVGVVRAIVHNHQNKGHEQRRHVNCHLQHLDWRLSPHQLINPPPSSRRAPASKHRSSTADPSTSPTTHSTGRSRRGGMPSTTATSRSIGGPTTGRTPWAITLPYHANKQRIAPSTRRGWHSR